MIPEGASPRVRGPWFWTGIVYGLFVLPWMGPFALPMFAVFSFLDGDIALGWILVGSFMVLAGIYLIWLSWYVGALQRSFKYELSKDTLTIERGVFWRKTSRIPLRRVQDVVNKQGPFLRAASVGSVHVQTAGLSAQSGGFGVEGLMVGLEDPVAVAEEILGKVKKLKGDV